MGAAAAGEAEERVAERAGPERCGQ